MGVFSQLFLSAGATLIVFGLYKLLDIIYTQIKSPLLAIPGPKSTSRFYGNFGEIVKAIRTLIVVMGLKDNSALHEKWFDEYGPTYKYYGLFNLPRLCTRDTRALNHILSQNYIYQKPEQVRYTLSRILGEGVLFVEGDQHKQQRKIMNPAFGPAQVRALTHVFTEKALLLRDGWCTEISNSEEGDSKGKRIDVLKWLSKMTLDVIGQAGFNYQFDALCPSSKANELNEAFSSMFREGRRLSLLPILQAYLPIFRLIPSDRARRIAIAQQTMARIGEKLLHDSKAAVAGTQSGEQSDIDDNGLGGRDLLTLLVRANMAVDLKESQRLSDVDVLAQVPTFLVAGHETTSTATTWALYALTQFPSAQTRLREELLTLSTDTPTMDELSSLPYLDCVIRETLRVHSPVPSTVRVAVKDDVIPLERPFVDRGGMEQYNLRISKGELVFIPILAMNRSTDIWGKDATTFRPERWESIPETAQGIPGVWGNQLSFLDGPRACIGYRFSIIEMKALLYTLVRAFEFELAVPAGHIASKQSIVSRPIVTSEPEVGNQMPLLIKPYCG